jgi:16S rRNA (adenine1518-N6/adenine1519-N6)-dimethyltransferase
MKKESLIPLKSLLQQSHFRIKKRLGQHFLINEDIMEYILSAAELNHNDIVIEVGAGLGILTRRIAEMVSHVVAVELDSKLADVLTKQMISIPNVLVVHGDILKISVRQLLQQGSNSPGSLNSYKVVANIPYYITSPILHHFLACSQKPSLMVLMVQKEVGEAIAAAPGQMSFLAVSVQLYSKPRILKYVPAEYFYPVPKVDSVVLCLEVNSAPLVDINDIEGFLDIVHCGFRAPRKQIHNSLALALKMPPGQILLLLEEAAIDPKRRPETLNLQEWEKLYRVFNPHRKQISC